MKNDVSPLFLATKYTLIYNMQRAIDIFHSIWDEGFNYLNPEYTDPRALVRSELGVIMEDDKAEIPEKYERIKEEIIEYRKINNTLNDAAGGNYNRHFINFIHEDYDNLENSWFGVYPGCHIPLDEWIERRTKEMTEDKLNSMLEYHNGGCNNKSIYYNIYDSDMILELDEYCEDEDCLQYFTTTDNVNLKDLYENAIND
jgi:hypothetical protein